MKISRKKFKKMKKRISKLESKVSRLECGASVMTYDWGRMTFPKLCRDLKKIIREEISMSKEKSVK